MELVGVIDIDPGKVGRDAGEIFGFSAAGVIVSDDTDAVLNMDADVILVYLPNMPDPDDLRPTGFGPNVENICRALRAKKNVLSPLPVYHFHKTAPELYEKLNQCALENGVTYVQQGISPGLYTPYLPVVLSSMAGQVDSIIVTVGEDDAYNSSPWVRVFGYGKDPEKFNSGPLKNIITSYYGPTAMVIADQAGIEYDEYVEDHEIFTAEVELNPPCGHVKPGTISAHVFSMRCLKDGKEVTGFHIIHKVCHDIQPEPAIADKIVIEGEPNITVSIDGVLPHDEAFSTSAAPSVNLIPQCADARPGFEHALDLPVSKPVA